MTELIGALLEAYKEATRLRHEKLNAKLESVNAIDPLSMALGNITEPRKKNVFLGFQII